MLKIRIKKSYFFRVYNLLKQYKGYRSRQYLAPSPAPIKQQVLLRNGTSGAVWVETGTYLGDTTKALSKQASFVFSIEPESTLFAMAEKRFKSFSNVEILRGVSEEIFPTLLPKLSGTINFWLDGHYSGEGTFAGPNDCPLLEELELIRANIHRFDAVTILIDDVRLCGSFHSYGNYPSLDNLVDFARSTNLDWHIEHDIFVAKSQSS